MPDQAQHPLQQIDRGIRQANLRLNRVLRLLEQQGPAGQDTPVAPAVRDVLFDLLEVVERTLQVNEASLAAPTPWWRRWRNAPPPPANLAGLRLACEDTLARLHAQGIEPAPRQGRVDPRMHRVLEVHPCTDPVLHGTISATARTGWIGPGDPPTVLRTAEVHAYQHAATPDELTT